MLGMVKAFEIIVKLLSSHPYCVDLPWGTTQHDVQWKLEEVTFKVPAQVEEEALYAKNNQVIVIQIEDYLVFIK